MKVKATLLGACFLIVSFVISIYERLDVLFSAGFHVL